MNQYDLKHLQSWFIAIMATSDMPETERSLIEMCEILNIEPVMRHRWMTGEDVVRYAPTVRKIAMTLVSLEQSSQ